MDFNDYQKLTQKTANYPKELGLNYATLGLVGEAGEVANKVKKIIRDDNNILTEERRKQLNFEIGDILWYCSQLATELDLNLENIAIDNIKKLNDRCLRNKINGDGDYR